MLWSRRPHRVRTPRRLFPGQKKEYLAHSRMTIPCVGSQRVIYIGTWTLRACKRCRLVRYSSAISTKPPQNLRRPPGSDLCTGTLLHGNQPFFAWDLPEPPLWELHCPGHQQPSKTSYVYIYIYMVDLRLKVLVWIVAL